MDTQGY